MCTIALVEGIIRGSQRPLCYHFKAQPRDLQVLHLRKLVTTCRVAPFPYLPTNDPAKVFTFAAHLASEARRVVNPSRFIRVSRDTESFPLLQRHRLHRDDQKRLSISSSHSGESPARPVREDPHRRLGVARRCSRSDGERHWKSSAQITDFYCTSKCMLISIRELRQWKRNCLRNLLDTFSCY